MIQVNIIGNVGKVEAKASKDGSTLWTEFSVATTKRLKDGQKKTIWFKCACFGNRSENALKLIKVGHKIFVQGDLDASAYVNKMGEAAFGLEVIVRHFELLNYVEDSALASPVATTVAKHSPLSEANLDNFTIPF